jgi:hypothetical protein
MTNPKALAVTERTALANTLFENPELIAMTAICEILQELPDEGARLRVMRWAFARFSTEFRRDAPAEPARVPAAPAVAAPGNEDFDRQISELEDLFSSSSLG